MKKYSVLIVLLFLGSMTIFAQEKINWLSMDEALALQSENPKKIIMDVYTLWCGPCKLLDKNTFGNTEVIKFINNNYYVYIDEGDVTIWVKVKGYQAQNFPIRVIAEGGMAILKITKDKSQLAASKRRRAKELKALELKQAGIDKLTKSLKKIKKSHSIK